MRGDIEVSIFKGRLWKKKIALSMWFSMFRFCNILVLLLHITLKDSADVLGKWRPWLFWLQKNNFMNNNIRLYF